MRLPTSVITASGTVLASVTLSLLVTAHHSTPAKTQHPIVSNASTTNQATPTTQIPPATSAAAHAAVAGASTSASSTSAHTNASFPAATTSQPPQTPSNPQPVTVVSATLSAWQNDNVSEVFIGGAHDGQTRQRQRQYCIYTYSDNSTQQITYAFRYLWSDGTIEPDTKDTPATQTCDLSTAPSPA